MTTLVVLQGNNEEYFNDDEEKGWSQQQQQQQQEEQEQDLTFWYEFFIRAFEGGKFLSSRTVSHYYPEPIIVATRTQYLAGRFWLDDSLCWGFLRMIHILVLRRRVLLSEEFENR